MTTNNKGGLVSCSGKWGKTQARRRSVDFSICYLFSSWFPFLSFANRFQVDFSICYLFPWTNKKDTRGETLHLFTILTVQKLPWFAFVFVGAEEDPDESKVLCQIKKIWFCLLLGWKWYETDKNIALDRKVNMFHINVGSQAPLKSIKVPDWLSEWQCHMKRAKN